MSGDIPFIPFPANAFAARVAYAEPALPPAPNPSYDALSLKYHALQRDHAKLQAELAAADLRLAEHENEAHALTARQIEIVECIARGMSNKEIAREIGLSEATVKIHLKAVMRKTRCQNRTKVAMWWVEQKKAAEAI